MINGILSAVSNIASSGGNSALLAASADEESSGSFMIKLLKEVKIGNTTVYITSTHVCICIISLIILAFAIVVNQKIKAANADDTPGMIQNIAEMIVETIANMVKGVMGTSAGRFVNYIATLFIFVVLCNISGLFGLRPPTADYGVTLPLGLITFVLIHYNGIKKNKGKHFTDLLKPNPILFPINLIGEIAVPLSLSVRLFGNVMSGTVLMGLIYGLLKPFTFAWPSVLHIYFDIFSGCIQAYVISMLTMVYISDKIGD